VDTQDQHYQPEELPTEGNPFAYAPAELQPGGLLPSRGSPAGDGTINGALILFQIDAQSLQNRPVQLVFGGDVGEPGTIDLDI